MALHIGPAVDDVSKCKSNIVALHSRSTNHQWMNNLCKSNIVALHIDPAIDDVSKCKSNIVALHSCSGEWILYTVSVIS